MAQKLNITLSLTADATQAKAQIKALQQELQNLAKTAGGNTTNRLGITKEINDAVLKVNELRAVLRKATDDTTGKLDLSKFNQALAQSGTSIKQYRDSLYALGPQGRKAFTQLATSVANADARILSANSSLKKMAVTLANTIRWQVAASAINTIVGSVQAAVGYVEDLDKSLNRIRIVSGQSADQMAQFAVQANKAAQALSTTTTAYTDASLIFFQQGLTGDAVTDRTNAVIKMAQVTGDSVEEVSSYMTAIWNNFDQGSKSLEYYADVIAKLGATTASSSSEISQGLEKFAAVAQASGLSYEYATSALATIVAATRQSADTVGTSLKTLFARIQDLELGKTLDDGTTLGKYSQALESVGVNIKDVNGDLKSMDTILDELGARWGTLADDVKIAVAQAVGGTRQYNQLIALMDNWQSMQQNIATARGAEGTVNQQAAIYAESWEAAQKRVKAASQEIYKALIDEKFFIGIDNTITKLLNGTAGLIKNLGGVQGVISTLASFIISKFNNEIATGIDNLIFKFKNLGKDSEAIRKETVNAAIEGLNQGPAASTNETEVQFLKDRLNLQSLLITYNKNMTDVQKEAYALQLDMLTAQKDEIVNTQKQLALTKEQVALDQKRAQALAVGFAQRKAKEEQKEALAEQKQLEKARDDIQKQLNKQRTADINSQKKQLEDEKKRITDDIINAKKELDNLPKQRKEAEKYLEANQKTFNKKGGDRATWNEYSNKLKDNGEGDYYTRRDKELRQNIRKLKEAEEKAESNITKFDESKIDVTNKSKSTAYKDLEMQLKEAEKAIENFNKNNAAKINLKFNRDEVKADIEKQFTNLRTALETEVKIDPFKESLQKISSSKTIPEMQAQWKALREEIEKSGQKVEEIFGKDLVKALEAPNPNLVKIQTEIKNLREVGATGRENFASVLINDFGFDESTTSDLIARMQSCTSTEEALKVMTEALKKATNETEGGLRNFSDSIVTTGQKIQTSIQAFSNLSMALNTIAGSVATLTSDDAGGLQKLSAIFMIATTSMRAITSVSEAFALKTKKTTAAVAGEAAAQAADAAATTANGAAHDKASGSIGKLKNAFTGAGKAAGIATAVIMGLVLVTEAIKNVAINAAEAQIKSAEANMKKAEATKEELEAQKELYDAYKDALKTYENTGEGKAKLADAAREVANAYGVEGASVAILTGNYKALSQAIDEAETKRNQQLINTEQSIQQSAITKAEAEADKAQSTSDWNIIGGVLKRFIAIPTQEIAATLIDNAIGREGGSTSNEWNTLANQEGLNLLSKERFNTKNNTYNPQGEDLIHTSWADPTALSIHLSKDPYLLIQQYEALIEDSNEQVVQATMTQWGEAYEKVKASLQNEQAINISNYSREINKTTYNTFKEYDEARKKYLKDLEKFGEDARGAFSQALAGTEQGSIWEDLARYFDDNEGLEEFYNTLDLTADDNKAFINFAQIFGNLPENELSEAWNKLKDQFEQITEANKIQIRASAIEFAKDNLKDNMSDADWESFFEGTSGLGWSKEFKTQFQLWTPEEQQRYLDTLDEATVSEQEGYELNIKALEAIREITLESAKNATTEKEKLKFAQQVAAIDDEISNLQQQRFAAASKARVKELEQIAKYREELDKLKNGDILSQDLMAQLDIDASQLEEYLSDMGDGTYRLVNAAEEFVKVVKNASFEEQYKKAQEGIDKTNKAFDDFFEIRKGVNRPLLDEESYNAAKNEWQANADAETAIKALLQDEQLLRNAWLEENLENYVPKQEELSLDVYREQLEEKLSEIQAASRDEPEKANYTSYQYTEADEAEARKQLKNIASENGLLSYIEDINVFDEGTVKEIQDVLKEAEKKLTHDVLQGWANSKTDFNDLEDWLQKHPEATEEFQVAWENLNNELERTGVNIQELDGYKKYLDNFKGGIIALDADTRQLGEEVLRTNGGFADLISNFTKWDDAMQRAKPGTQAYYDAINGLRNATANLLDVDPAQLDDNFLTDPEVHALFMQAVSGDTEAIKELHNELIEFTVSTYEGLEDLIDPLQDELSHIQIGGTVSEEFLAKLQEFIEKLGVSQTEAENLLGIIGLEGYNYRLNEAGKVKSFESARRKAQGAFATYNNNIQQKKSVKGDSSQFKTEVERYHEINKVLEDMERKLKRIENVKSKAFGPDKIKAIKDEVGMLNAENKAYEERLREANEYLQMDRAKVLSLGAQLDENGIITNYSQVATGLNNQYNQGYVEYINAQNAAIAAYNQTGNQDAYDKALEAINEKWKAVQQLNKENVDALKQYEDTIKQIEEDKTKQLELRQQIRELALEEIQVKVDLKLELNEREVKLLQRQIELLGKGLNTATDRIEKYAKTAESAIKASNGSKQGIEELLSNAGITQSVIAKYFNSELSESELEQLVNSLTEDEFEELKTLTDKIGDSAKEIEETFVNVLEEIRNAFDTYEKQFDKFENRLSSLSKFLDNINNTINLVGAQKLDPTGQLRQMLANSQVEVAQGELDTSKIKLQGLQDKLADLEAAALLEEVSGNEQLKEKNKEDIEEIQQLILEAQGEVSDNAYKLLEQLHNQLTKNIEISVEQWEKAISGSAGNLDNLQAMFDMRKDVADDTVADYRRIYELTKLTRDITESINDSTNIKNNERLAALQERITAEMESQEASSEYTLENYRREYELLLAQAQLEDARNNKTSLKLKRDSQGNYSYQYDVDENAINDALQNYEDKLYALQKANDERQQELQEEFIALNAWYAEQVSHFDEYDQARQEEITRTYNERLNRLGKETERVINNNSSLYDNEWTNYSKMTGYKISADKDYIDSWDELQLASITGFETLDEYMDAHIAAAETMVQKVGGYLADYDAEIQNQIGTQQQYAQATTATMQSISDDVKATTEEVNRFSENFEEKFALAVGAAKNFATEYSSKMNIVETVSQTVQNNLNNVITKAIKLTEAVNGIPADFTRNYKLVYDIVTNGTAPDLPEAIGGNEKVEPKDLKENDDDVSSGNYNNSNNYLLLDYYTHANLAQIDASEGQGAAYTRAAFISKDRNRRIKIVYPYSSYDTGGYTGNWNSSEGRLAMLHQKELVLNASDTSNMLEMVSAVRDLAGAAQANVAGNIAQMIADNIASALYNTTTINNGMQQQVTINADFPAATSAYEIETALNSLVNKATQRAGISQNYR